MKKSMLGSKTNENATGANTKRRRRREEFHIAKFLSCVRTAFTGLPVPISLPTSQYIYFAAPAIIYLFHKISTRAYNLKAQATDFVVCFNIFGFILVFFLLFKRAHLSIINPIFWQFALYFSPGFGCSGAMFSANQAMKFVCVI